MSFAPSIPVGLKTSRSVRFPWPSLPFRSKGSFGRQALTIVEYPHPILLNCIFTLTSSPIFTSVPPGMYSPRFSVYCHILILLILSFHFAPTIYDSRRLHDLSTQYGYHLFSTIHISSHPGMCSSRFSSYGHILIILILCHVAPTIYDLHYTIHPFNRLPSTAEIAPGSCACSRYPAAPTSIPGPSANPHFF